MKILVAFSVLAALGCVAPAQTRYLATGDLSASDPKFVRPDGRTRPGTFLVTYDVFRFQVSANGMYAIETGTDEDLDTYLLLYQDGFDPARPLENLLMTNGDVSVAEFTVLPTNYLNPGGSRIGNGPALSVGRTYFAVVTVQDPTFFIPGSAYNIGIGGGPGRILNASAVPEPASLAALGLGAAAILRRRRKSA